MFSWVPSPYTPQDLQMPLTFGYLLDDDTQAKIKSKTSEVFNKTSMPASSAKSPGASSSKSKSKQSDAAAALSEVSDMFG